MTMITEDQQLELWVQGHSLHIGTPLNVSADTTDEFDFSDFEIEGIPELEAAEEDDGMCCPDFSCCRPNLQWSQALREKYRDGDELTKLSMTQMSMTAMYTNEGVDVTPHLRHLNVPMH